jgi:hypothetical protein
MTHSSDMKLIITIDTEADNQWAHSEAIELKNIAYIPRFQDLCDTYHFKPTYLVTYEMATAEQCIRTVGVYQQQNKAEIGAHLHPWTTPPLIPLTDNDIQYHPFPYEYPPAVLTEKLRILTETIAQNFGQKPLTFRAGRYGFNGTVASILADLGYIADCSITPFVSWKHILGNPRGYGGPDFSHAPFSTYFVDLTDCTKPGNSRLLEVPVSIFFVKYPVLNRSFHRWKHLFKDPNNLLLRSCYQLGVSPVWFRPYPKSKLDDLCRVYYIARYLDIDYLEMIFHSSELMPGGSKNTKDPHAIETVYELLNGLFKFLAQQQIESVTLSEYAEHIIATRKDPHVQ